MTIVLYTHPQMIMGMVMFGLLSLVALLCLLGAMFHKED